MFYQNRLPALPHWVLVCLCVYAGQLLCVLGIVRYSILALFARTASCSWMNIPAIVTCTCVWQLLFSLIACVKGANIVCSQDITCKCFVTVWLYFKGVINGIFHMKGLQLCKGVVIPICNSLIKCILFLMHLYQRSDFFSLKDRYSFKHCQIIPKRKINNKIVHSSSSACCKPKQIREQTI